MSNLVALHSHTRKSPTTVNRKVLTRPTNVSLRPREYLTPSEVTALIEAARKVGRHGQRDATLLLLAYRHGLRVSELVGLQWSQVDLKAATLHVSRLKNGMDSSHPLRGTELRALRGQLRDNPSSPYVFLSERGAPLTPNAIRKLVQRAGTLSGLPFPAHPHMLRHACGYKLANEGHDTRAIQHYLGHKNIQHTVRYTEMSPTRFRDFWRD
jgi:type 1 fimbriae regulatory protein FimE